MENNINTKKSNVSMEDKNNNKSILWMFSIGTLLWVLVLITSSFAVQQATIINYPFESSSGTIVSDVSGNGYNAILLNGASFNAISEFGSYAMYCNGATHYGVSTTPFPTTINKTISFWVRPNTGNTNKTTFTNTLSANDYSEIYYDWATNTLNYEYTNATSSGTNSQVKIIDNFILSTSAFTHIVISIDGTNNLLSYYKNGVPVLINSPISGGIHYNASELKTLYLCKDWNLGNTYYGKIDEYNQFNFVLNSSQVSSLYNSNTITYFYETNVTIANNTQLLNVINSSSPTLNQVVQNNIVTFDVLLNHKASCDLYVDNNLIYTKNDSVAWTYQKVFNEGDYKYFLQCSYIDNSTLYQQLTLPTNFSVSPIPSTMTFRFYPTDFKMEDTDLFLVTPCLNKGYGLGLFSFFNKHYDFYRSEYNKNGAYFFPIDKKTGTLSLNLSPDEYSFCVINGLVMVNEQGRTNNYNINNLQGYFELGTLDLPNNVTQTYDIRLESLDVYNIYNPKAWGKTWRDVIIAVIMFSIGGLVLFFGVRKNNGKMAFVGAIIILAGIGVSIGTIVGLLF